jgi:adenylate cyclase
VIGDTVNMASRIEGMTKEIGAPILVSDSVVAHLPGALRLGQPTEALLKGRAGSNTYTASIAD